MTPREIVKRDQAVTWFYAIGCDLRDIGAAMGITHERVRAIVARDRPEIKRRVRPHRDAKPLNACGD